MKHEFIIYLFKVILCSGIFSAYYYVFLRDTRIFGFNRFYLLISAIMSFIIPFAVIPLGLKSDIPTQIFALLPAVEITQNKIQPEITVSVIPFVYVFIIMGFIVKTIISYFKIAMLKKSAKIVKFNGIELHCIKTDLPFTLVTTIFWSNNIDLLSKNGNCILNHEKAHVKLLHGIDKILMQALCCLGWINPFFYYMQRELGMVHEYEADNISAENNTETLASMLLYGLYPNYYNNITSQFNQSSIKRRIIMITNKKQKNELLRKFCALPLFIMLIGALNVKAQEIKQAPEQIGNLQVYNIQNENLTKPKYQGGIEEMYKFIANNFVMPVSDSTQTKIYISFIVNDQGKITDDISVLHITDTKNKEYLENEIKRVFLLMPLWTPGEMDGKKVAVIYTLPIFLQYN